MANFKPLKTYLVNLIDDLIKEYGLEGPFLDAGCGLGDVSLHLAKKGWRGQAIDISSRSLAIAREVLAPFCVEVKEESIQQTKGLFKTILLLDVIEHEEDDEGLIRSVGKNLTADGALIISTPINQHEWRWDDEYYGHIRRYETAELSDLLERNGYDIVDLLDFTFPIFWLIRRGYTRFVPKKVIISEGRNRTINSALQSAWDKGVFSSLIEKIIWWQPVFWLQKRYRKKILGCECLLLARKR